MLVTLAPTLFRGRGAPLSIFVVPLHWKLDILTVPANSHVLRSQVYRSCTCNTSCKLSGHRQSTRSSLQPVMSIQVLRGGARTARMSDVATSFMTEIYNEGNVSFVDDVTTEDIVFSDRVWSEADVCGRKRLRRFLEAIQQGYPDIKVHLDTVLAREDSNVVMIHWSCRASNLGEFRGNPATGRVSIYSGITMFTFNEDCLIKEITTYRQATTEEHAVYFGWEHY